MKMLTDTHNFNCNHAVQCIFNLNKLDIKVLNELKKHSNVRADELAKIIKKERSTVYRSLQKLTNCGVCIKKTKTIKKGGYYHSYSCSNTNKIKETAEKCLEEWYSIMKKTLNQLNE